MIDNGGEGVILRKPKSFYEHGRTQSLLKLKVCSYYPPSGINTLQASRADREALVLEVHENLSLLLKLYVQMLLMFCALI